MKHSPAYRVATTILHGFEEYRTRFKAITADASRRFREAAWREAQQASAERINLYSDKVDDTVVRLQRACPRDVLTHCETWQEARSHFAIMISQRLDFELAETFFNSLFCAVFQHRHIHNDRMFVESSRDEAPRRSGVELCQRHVVDGDWEGALAWALLTAPLDTPYADVKRDTRRGAQLLGTQLPPTIWQAADAELELLTSVFYRNKGAYLVGRILGGGQQVPLVLPILHGEGFGEEQNGDARLHLDAVLTDTSDVSIIFSFTRVYFQVDVPVPGEFVSYLQELMPHKPAGELYAAIGFFKHGKTAFFRSLNQQVAKRAERFVIAPGVRGMVMAVFVLPSARTVFKIIKDTFDPAKDMTREDVREKYRLVKRHDRVGRMADTQEFANFRVRKDHFDPECLAHLLDVAPSNVLLKGDKVLLKHCYTERMMVPLNLYLEQCTAHEQTQVLKDYGNAIKQMAAANIFPGDMLLKNFGVTRQGRVIFYDYDEVCYLTDCRFRVLPPSDAGAASVGPYDIFPEEFALFMFASARLREEFTSYHPELFDPGYWQGVQQAIRDGRVIDVYPYRNQQRFAGRMDQLVH